MATLAVVPDLQPLEDRRSGHSAACPEWVSISSALIVAKKRSAIALARHAPARLIETVMPRSAARAGIDLSLPLARRTASALNSLG